MRATELGTMLNYQIIIFFLLPAMIEMILYTQYTRYIFIYFK